MATVLIVYGSTMGNTETAANMIADILREAGHSAIVLDVVNAEPNGLCAGFDCALFGSSTWGDGDLQDSFAFLYDCFDNISVSGVKAAAFGCGDSGYPAFCNAVTLIQDKLEEVGAKVVAQGLKIDGNPADSENDINSWAAEVAKAL